MKQIETSRGRFVVMDVDYNQHCFVRIGLKATAMYNSRELFDYDESYKLSEITEEEASSIVNDYCVKYKNPLQCLKGLLESKEIEITNNTYIFKV